MKTTLAILFLISIGGIWASICDKHKLHVIVWSFGTIALTLVMKIVLYEINTRL